MIALGAGVFAIFVPRVRAHAQTPALDEVGSASPLPDPAYADESF